MRLKPRWTKLPLVCALCHPEALTHVILSAASASHREAARSRRTPNAGNSLGHGEFFPTPQNALPWPTPSELIEVLRLHGCFAKRSNHFAQDDNRRLTLRATFPSAAGLYRHRVH